MFDILSIVYVRRIVPGQHTEWAAAVTRWANTYESRWFIAPRSSCFNHRGLADEEDHEDLWLWGRVTAVPGIPPQIYKSRLLLERDSINGEGLSNHPRPKLPRESTTLLHPPKNQSEVKAFQWLRDPSVSSSLAKVISPFWVLGCLFYHGREAA